MKRTIIFSALLALVCSCDLLNTYPANQIADGNMWATASMSQAAVDGLMYPFMRHKDGLSTLMCDDGTGGLNRMGMEGMGYTSIFDGTIPFLKGATKQASGVENAAEWMNLFTIVQSCNKVISNLRASVVGDDMYQQYMCEARMIRAYAYSRLVMIFGEVPIYLEEVDNAQCNKTQSSWDDVWQFVIKECTECIANSKFQVNNITGPRLYKPSKGMAYALRGNAYMWLAANKKPEIDDDAKGISDSEIQDYYKAAASDFAKVKECGFGLWKGGAWEELFTEANEHNCEMIFPLEFTHTAGYSSSWVWVISSRSNLNGWNRLVPSADFVDDFEWNDGSKFDWTQVFPDWKSLKEGEREVFFLRDSLDTYNHPDSTSNRALIMKGCREKEILKIGETVWNKYYLDNGNEARLRTAYDTRDPRLDKAVMTPYKPYRCFNEFITKPINFVLRWPRTNREDTVDGSDLWLEFSANMMYSWNKYMTSDGTVNDRTLDCVDWPIIRFTQIQLMWAEALAQTGDIEGAKTLVNEVRTRAGMPDVTTSDKDQLMEEIRYETRVELCQEGKNFFDEVRWGTYKATKFQGRKQWDPRSCWGEGGWKTGYYYVDGMWPLSAPLNEIVRNSNLKRRSKGWSY